MTTYQIKADKFSVSGIQLSLEDGSIDANGFSLSKTGLVYGSVSDAINPSKIELVNASHKNTLTVDSIKVSDLANTKYVECKEEGIVIRENASSVTFSAESLNYGASSATWANIILNNTGADDLEAVLNLGNVASRDIDLSGNNISRCNNLDVSSINGASYPLPVATLDQVLAAGNFALRDLDLSGNNISRCNNLDVSSINGASYPLPVARLDQVLAAGNFALRDLDLSGNDILRCNNLNIIDDTNQNTTVVSPNYVRMSDGNTGAILDNSGINTSGGLRSWTSIVQNTGLANNLSTVLGNGNTATGPNATITLTDTDVGGATNPILTLNNTNATGSVALEVYKNKPTAGVVGDVLFNQSVYGKDSSNIKQEYTRITHTIRDAGVGVEDGSIEFACYVNASVNTFLQINGNENEVNILKTMDMTGNTMKSSTGNMTLTTVGSSGSGEMFIQSKGTVSMSAPTIGITATGASSALNLHSTGDNAYVSIQGADDVSITAGTGDILMTTGGVIKTDEIITTLSTTGGNKIDFSNGSPDLLFDINREKVRLHWNDATSETATILLDNQYDSTCAMSMMYTTATGDITTQHTNTSTTQSIYTNDTRSDHQKYIKLDNSGTTENRIDMRKNQGGGVYQESILANSTTSQGLFLSHTNNANNKSININNHTNGSGNITFSNSVDTNAFIVESVNTNLVLSTLSNTSGQGNIIISPETSGGNLIFNGANIQSTTSGSNSGQHLRIILNGTAYKIRLESD